jgi:hypothetical protein
VGASWVRKNILETYPDAPLSVYVVWVTQLGATRDDIDLKLFTDERVKTYWDPDGLAGDAIAADTGADWDVYALYGPDAHWGTRPAGLVDSGAPVIADPDRLAQRVEALART